MKYFACTTLLKNVNFDSRIGIPKAKAEGDIS